MNNNLPIEIMIDICGGYHASIWPEKFDELTFKAGLSELYLIYQIKNFYDQISEIYNKGARLKLLIDNGVANYANQIPFEKTADYIESFRELIHKFNMHEYVSLLVETEEFKWEDLVKKIKERDSYDDLKEDAERQHDIIERFLGRHCSIEESCMHLGKYMDSINISDEYINKIEPDVIRLKQRASDKNLCFRSFPGSSSRIQAGQVGFKYNSKNKIIPTLITIKNHEQYEIKEIGAIYISENLKMPIYFAKSITGSTMQLPQQVIEPTWNSKSRLPDILKTVSTVSIESFE